VSMANRPAVGIIRDRFARTPRATPTVVVIET